MIEPLCSLNAERRLFSSLGQTIFKKSYMAPLYLLIIIVKKFDPLTGMVSCVDLGPKFPKFITLSLRLSEIEYSLCSLRISGIKFRLVSD